MTTFATLSNELLVVVKRPDLQGDGTFSFHLRNAILKAHKANYFLKDLAESAVNYSDYVQGSGQILFEFEPRTLFPRFRTTKYITILDPQTANRIRNLAPLEPEQIVDNYGYYRDNVFYASGSLIKMRTSCATGKFGFGYYQNPDVTLAQPSWIADEFPFAIVYEAARTLFKSIGYDEQSASMQQLLAEAMAEVVQTGITTVGE